MNEELQAAFLALSMRRVLVQCPICNAGFDYGRGHYEECRLFRIEEAALEMWPDPFNNNTTPEKP